jgi:hypothetical protein
VAVPTIQSAQIKAGPGRIYYAPMATAIPTLTAVASKISGAWTSWVEVGATEDGLIYSENTDVSDLRVAESKYPVRKVVTNKSASVAFTISHMSDLSWKLAMNGGVITVSGATTTKLSVYVPPLVGAEVTVMLGFQSLDDDEAFVWPQCFNVGSVETVRGNFDALQGLPCEFDVQLPDPAILTTPYKRWTTGSLSQSP